MRKLARILILLLFTMWSAVTLSLMDVDVQRASCTLFYIRDCILSSPVNASLAALLCVLLFFLYRRLLYKPYDWQRKEIPRGFLFSVPLSFVLTLSPAYGQGDEALVLFTQPYHLLLLLFKFLGFIPLLFALYREILVFLSSKRFTACFRVSSLQDNQAALCKRFLVFWLLLAACWLPLWAARFPGVITEDAGRALQQYFFEAVRTNDHPYFFTLLMGGVVRLGVLLGSGNLGVALFIGLQITLLSGVFAFTLRDMAKAGYSAGLQGSVFCFYAFLPIIVSNVGLVMKDMLFSAAFVGYLIVLSCALLQGGTYRKQPRWWAFFILFSCLLLLIRPNGKMVVWPMTIVLLFDVWQAAPLKRKIAHSALLLAPVLAAVAFQCFIEAPALIPVDSTADILGVPLQQTARVIRDHEESVTQRDRETIESLYPYDELAGAYSPRITDPTRITYRYFDEVFLRQKLDFLGTWASLNARHPLTAFHAFWALNSGYIDPTADGSVYQSDTLPAHYYKYPAAVGSVQPEALRSLRNRVAVLEEIWRNLPFVRQLNNVGLYPWLLLLGFLLLWRKPCRRVRWLYLPSFAIFIGCLLAPGFYSCTRYAFPLVFGTPYLLALTGAALGRHADA